MKTEQELENAIKQKKEELVELRDQLRDVKDELYLPNLRNQYERKYFKYNNGTDENPEWIYSYCYRLTSHEKAILDYFRIDHEGMWLFAILSEQYLYMLEAEITKEEYYEGLSRMKHDFEKLYF